MSFIVALAMDKANRLSMRCNDETTGIGQGADPSG